MPQKSPELAAIPSVHKLRPSDIRIENGIAAILHALQIPLEMANKLLTWCGENKVRVILLAEY